MTPAARASSAGSTRRFAARRFAARRSAVHGRGVFALTDLHAEERIAEYRGEVITWAEAQVRYGRAEQTAGHTFFFDLGNGSVIDGGSRGNSARWLNHGCDPNCEPVEHGGRVVIYARRPIAAGDELLIDYQLVLEARRTAATRALYACRCGARNCRGTMLAPG